MTIGQVGVLFGAMERDTWLVWVLLCIVWVGCGFPRPSPLGGEEGDDGGTDAPSPFCTANQPRCEGNQLLRCNSDGTAEISESCSIGCSVDDLRCKDVRPSNGLGVYLDMTGSEPDLDLGTTASINTDDGSVVVDGKPVMVRSALMAQASAPTILVFVVHSLIATDVTITGSNAFALVSNGDVKIGGVFAASAVRGTPGAGRFNDGTCQGGPAIVLETPVYSGAGGGGFGLAGGNGGSATSGDGSTASGGAGGTPTGNPALVPLRGGCDAGKIGGLSLHGTGGGAMQLVSRTLILLGGVIAANGSAETGGGSGGGILLEAPVVDVSGSVVANGGAGNAVAGNGATVNLAGTGATAVSAGYGGGSVGRIRINTISGGFHRAGVFSPNPSTGAIATR